MTSEQSPLVREGASYDEFYLSSRGPEEGLTWPPKREPFAHSPNDEEEEDYEADGGEDGEEVEEGKGGEERRGKMRRKRVMKGVTKKVTS